jgi:hypothetical protein
MPTNLPPSPQDEHVFVGGSNDGLRQIVPRELQHVRLPHRTKPEEEELYVRTALAYAEAGRTFQVFSHSSLSVPDVLQRLIAFYPHN